MMSEAPKHMIERAAGIRILKAKGWDSATLSHMTDDEVRKALESNQSKLEESEDGSRIGEDV